MSFKCSFCGKPQSKGKRPTLLLTSVHNVPQYHNIKGHFLGETTEIGGEKPACEACCATPNGLAAIATRTTLGKVLMVEENKDWLVEAIEENVVEEDVDA